MSDTMDPMATEVDQQELAQRLLAQAREQGIELVGPDGLLNRLTKNVLETALEAEMDEHLGYGKHDVSGRGCGNSRSCTRTKTVMTEIGPVEIDVPRDTGSTFDPQVVKKRQRRLAGVDEIVLPLCAKGPTTGEIAAHFAEVFGARPAGARGAFCPAAGPLWWSWSIGLSFVWEFPPAAAALET